MLHPPAANDRPKLPRNPPDSHQQTRRQPHRPQDEGRDDAEPFLVLALSTPGTETESVLNCSCRTS